MTKEIAKMLEGIVIEDMAEVTGIPQCEILDVMQNDRNTYIDMLKHVQNYVRK